MRALAMLAAGVLAALVLTPRPANAQLTGGEENDLRIEAHRFLQSGDLAHLEAIEGLLARARGGSDSGMAWLGLYDGPMLPLAEPVALVGVAQVGALCRTSYHSTPPGTTPPEGDDHYTLRRHADGWVDVDFQGHDAQGDMRLELRSNGTATAITRFRLHDDQGDLDLQPEAEGLRDALAGQVFAPGSADYEGLVALASAIIANNPSWFLQRGQVVLGQPWLGDDASPEAAYQGATAVLSAVTGGAASMDGTRIAIGATGQTLRAGQPAIVFELIGKTSVRSPAGIDIDMVLSGYELVDVATLFRVAATYRIDMEFSGRQMIIVQRQSCTLE